MSIVFVTHGSYVKMAIRKYLVAIIAALLCAHAHGGNHANFYDSGKSNMSPDVDTCTCDSVREEYKMDIARVEKNYQEQVVSCRNDIDSINQRLAQMDRGEQSPSTAQESQADRHRRM
jgi:hypothetical protein